MKKKHDRPENFLPRPPKPEPEPEQIEVPGWLGTSPDVPLPPAVPLPFPDDPTVDPPLGDGLSDAHHESSDSAD